MGGRCETVLTRLARFVLSLLAYSPLFVILLIKNLPLRSGLIAGFIVFSAIATFSWFIIRSIEGLSGERVTVEINQNLNDQYLGFIVTYIAPFIGTIRSTNDLIAMLILMSIIFSLYLTTSLFAVNPLLKLLFRYNIYLCTINNKEGLLLSKEILKRNEKLSLMAYCVDESVNLFIHSKR